MSRISLNVEKSRGYFWDTLQLTNFILDSGVTCHMTPDISDFVPGSLVETDKYIEVVDGHFFTAKKKGQVQIKIWENYGKPFIATL